MADFINKKIIGFYLLEQIQKVEVEKKGRFELRSNLKGKALKNFDQRTFLLEGKIHAFEQILMAIGYTLLTDERVHLENEFEKRIKA